MFLLKLLCMLNFILHISFSFKIYVDNYSKNEQILQCISKFSEDISELTTLVISSVLNEGENMWKYTGPRMLLSLQNSTKIYQNLTKIDCYILIFSTGQQLREWLQEIYLFEFFNPRGKFIVSILESENVTEIFETAWTYYIININILLFNNDALEVSTYYPYKSTDCSLNLTSELLFQCSRNEPPNLFPEKVSHNFNGCPIRLHACVIFPYVINTSANWDNPRSAGLEVTIMNALMTKLNFTQVYVKHNYPTWGYKLPNGTYTFMFDELQKRNTDLIIGFAYLAEGMTNFEALVYVLIDFVIWWVTSADPLPPWTNLFNIFTPITWIMIFTSVLINGIIWWLFSKDREQTTHFKHLPECIFASWYVVLQGSIGSPKSKYMKILYIFWLMYSILLYTAHQSQLVSTLMKPVFEKQISSLDELLNTNMKIGYFTLAEKAFQDTGDQRHKKIMKNHVTCGVNGTCMNQTAFQRNMATLAIKAGTKFRMQKYYLHPDGRPMLYGFGPGFSAYSRYILKKGFPPTVRLNTLIMLLASNGLISNWYKEVFNERPYTVQPQLQSLSLAHLIVGFIFLFIGLSIASITFALEIIVSRFKIRTHVVMR